MSYVHIFLRLPNNISGEFYEKKYSFEVFFHNRLIPRTYFRKNDNMKFCFETPQKIEQLTTIFR